MPYVVKQGKQCADVGSLVSENLLIDRNYLAKVCEHMVELRQEKRHPFVILYSCRDDAFDMYVFPK